jgi:phosphatidylglycerophosphate synthase
MNRERRPGGISYRSALQLAGRGTGLYSDWVVLPLSSLVTMAFLSVHPTVLTLANLAVGSAASLLAILAVNAEPAWPIGLLVLAGWQVAYVLDCADGQIARATRKASVPGALVDMLSDVAMQSTVVAALCVAVAHDHDVPVALLSLFATTWMVGFVATALLRGTDEVAHRLLPARSPIVALLKLPRDYGFMSLMLGLAYGFARPLLLVLVLGILALNLVYLAGMIGREARLSLLASRSTLAAAE